MKCQSNSSETDGSYPDSLPKKQQSTDAQDDMNPEKCAFIQCVSSKPQVESRNQARCQKTGGNFTSAPHPGSQHCSQNQSSKEVEQDIPYIKKVGSIYCCNIGG